MSAPNISLLNATYSAVSGVTLPKSGGGTATFPWVEGSETKTQNGTYDVTNLAQIVVNVAGGGGGGLVYEAGTYEPETDERAPTIYFTNTHTTEPMYCQITDTESSTATALSYISCLAANSGAYDDNPRTWGQARRSYINSNNNVTGSNTTFSSIYNAQVFMTNTYYKPAGNNTGYYFRAGRTYKWIAVWAPT